jgi:hypothetical protein
VVGHHQMDVPDSSGLNGHCTTFALGVDVGDLPLSRV